MLTSKAKALFFILKILMLNVITHACGPCIQPNPPPYHNKPSHPKHPPHHGGGGGGGGGRGKQPIITPPPVVVVPPIIVTPPLQPPPTIIYPPPTTPPVFPPPITQPPPVIHPPPTTPPVFPPPVTQPPPIIYPPPTSPPVFPPPITQPTCPIDALKLGLCLDVLGGLVHVGIGNPVENVCCPVIQGLADLEAAICLCTVIRAKVLNLNIYLPLALQVLVTCGKTPPRGFVCPPL